MSIQKFNTLHNLIQDILVNVLKEFGIDARKEFLNIDVVGKKDDKLITIEIDFSKDRAEANCEKCLFVNPTKHIHILINTPDEVLKKFENNAKVKILNYSYSLIGRKRDISDEKQPCDEVISEVKKFLEDVGFTEIIYWKDRKQIDGVLTKEIAEGEITYYILIDFVENKVMLEARVETEQEYEDYQIEYWKSIPQLYDLIISLMKHYGIYPKCRK